MVQKSKLGPITEVYDVGIENIKPGSKFWVYWNETDSEQIDVNDFIGWMYETGAIDNYHTEGKGMVEIGDDYHEYSVRHYDFICTKRGTLHYTFAQFFRDCVNDSDLIKYKQST